MTGVVDANGVIANCRNSPNASAFHLDYSVGDSECPPKIRWVEALLLLLFLFFFFFWFFFLHNSPPPLSDS